MTRAKKYFTLIVAVLLILANIPIAFAEADINGTVFQYSEADKESFKFSYNFYKTLGIIDGEYNIDSTITRGEWADIMVHFFGYESMIGAYKNVPYFDDYDSKYSKIASVNLAGAMGLMGEYDDGKFSPDTAISYEDAYTAIVKGLGYSAVSEINKDNNYYALAGSIGLLKGVTAVNGYPIIVSEALRMLDNALNINVLGAEIGSDELIKGETVLTGTLKLERKEGVVTSNCYSSLHSINPVSNGRIGIDNVLYRYNGSTEGLLGYNVYYYVSISDKEEVVYLAKKKNSVLEINFEDIVSYSSKVYKYMDGSVSKKQEIPTSCAVIYNDVALTDGFTSPLPMSPDDSGSLTFIDNDGDGTYDVLLIEAYTSFYIGQIDATNKKIYNMYDSTDVIALDDYANVEIFDAYGDEGTIAKMSPKNVLAVAKSPDKRNLRIHISTQNVTGTIKAINEDSGTYYVTVDDIKYRASKQFAASAEFAAIKSGSTGVFYLDYKNNLAGYDEKILAPVGYMINARMKKGELVIKMFTSSGEIKTFDCADKVRLFGDQKYPEDGLYTKLTTLGAGEVQPQIVLYELNDEGEIKLLDLVGISDRIAACWNVKSSAQYMKTAAGFRDGKHYLNGGALVFFIPANPSSADSDDFVVKQMSELKDKGNYCSSTVAAYGYRLSSGKQLGADILVVDSSFREETGYLGVIKSIRTVIDSDDEIYQEVKMYQAASEYTYYAYADIFDINTVKGKNDTTYIKKLEVGDVVTVNFKEVSGKRYLTKLELLYDVSADKYFYKNPNEASFTSTETRYFLGGVHIREGSLMSVVIEGGTATLSGTLTTMGPTTNVNAPNYEIHAVGGGIYRYDPEAKKNERVKKVKADEIMSYNKTASGYSTIWMYTTLEAPKMIYIIK